MAEKTATEKIEALFEKAATLLEDVEIDARLKHESGLGRSLANMANVEIYTDEEIGQLLADYDIADIDEFDDLKGVRAGLRMAGLMVGNHDLDTDDDTAEDGDDDGDASEPEAQGASADDSDVAEP